MTGIAVSRIRDVWIATIQHHAFSPKTMIAVHQLLDEVERTSGPSSLVFTATGRIFSGGLDFHWVRRGLQEGQAKVGNDLAAMLIKMCGRVLTFPVPTVAAIGGHCFGGGLMFACACDHRVMSDSEADVCMPVINIDLPPPRGGVDILRSKLHPAVFKDLLLTGERFEGKRAYSLGIVDHVVPKDSLLQSAVDFAQSLAHHATRRDVYGFMKRQTYKKEAEACGLNVAGYEEVVGSLRTFSSIQLTKPRVSR